MLHVAILLQSVIMWPVCSLVVQTRDGASVLELHSDALTDQACSMLAGFEPGPNMFLFKYKYNSTQIAVVYIL